jgi:hypothetical protein
VILVLAIAAVLLAGVGFFRRSPLLLAIAVALVVPFALYLGATPRFRGVGWLLPLPLAGATLLVRTHRSLAACLVGLFSVGFAALEMMLFGAFR